jgi:transglutaminase-like putative cysteine protease/predicted PurR-regulated permease PerM
MASLTRRFRLPPSPVEQSEWARVFACLALLVSLLAVAFFAQDPTVPLFAAVAVTVGHLVSLRERNQKRGFWRQVLLAGLIFGALCYLIADSGLALFGGTLPQAHFAILLAAITSFDLKTRRNLYSSLWISLAILYLAAVYAWDYAFVLFLFGWILCMAGFWVASHVNRFAPRLDGPRKPLAASVIATCLIGAVLFIVVPQPDGSPTGPLVLSLPNFTQFRGDMETAALPLVNLNADATGATTTVDLHFRGRLGDAPVMYVRTAAPAYWRGLVFDTYSNGAWTATNREYFPMPPYVPANRLPPEPPHNLGTFVQVFRVLRPLPGVINAAYPLQSLYVPVAALREDVYGTFHTPDQLRPGQTYSAVSYLPDLSGRELRTDQTLRSSPEDFAALSPRGQALAQRVVRDANATTDFDKVMAITTYLQHNYRYSLDIPPVPSGRDPVDWFLFDVKTGYCEQFATAAALMLRSLRIASRLATGYATGDYNATLNQAVVRERDAHAWVEVLFQEHGWVPVDPTPGIDPLAFTRMPSHWAAGGVAHLIPHLTIGAPVALGSLGAIAAIPAAIGIFVALALLVMWLRRRRPRHSVRAAPGESDLLRLYDRLQRKVGRRRAPPETPLEYLHASSAEELLVDVTEAVNEGVYAGRWPERERVREMADRLATEGRRRFASSTAGAK